MNSFKREKGITLIALVVTIIILLILAAVGLSAISKDGLFARAKNGVAAYQIAAANEVEKLREFEELMEGEVTSPAQGSGDLSTGTGTEADPILIQSIEDLVTLTNNVSPVDTAQEGETFNDYDGKYFKLEISLDFQSEESYLNPQGTTFGDVNRNGNVEPLITELTTGSGYRSIGKYDYTFNGIIDGNRKKIKNLKSDIGFIGMNGGSNSVVKNLTMENVNISATDDHYYLSGIISRAKASKTTIENCKVTGTISDCTNSGGMIGSADEDASEIVLSNNVSAVNIIGRQYNSYYGGIAGRLKGKVTITNNINKGSITTGSTMGGIVGQIESNDSNTMSGCYNEGTINGSGSVGGLVGQVSNGELSVTNCYNTATISGTGAYIGGLVGEYYSADGGSIINCYNTGNIIGIVTESMNPNYLGGLCSRICGNFTIRNCYNTGEITGHDNIGGIAGFDVNGKANIQNCYNTGKITGIGSNAGRCVGGIVAYSEGNNTNVLNCCYNSGMIDCQNSGNVGGIYGSGYYSSITNCYNTAIIKGDNYVGGIAGYASNRNCVIENCYNSGESVTISNYNSGGVIGYLQGTARKVYNLATIIKTANNIQCVGAICGYKYNSNDNYGLGIIENAAYLASTYSIGCGNNDYADTDETTRRVTNVSDLYSIIQNNLNGTEWELRSGANLPTLKGM